MLAGIYPVQPFSMCADVAQLVEHSTRNTGVMGSIPIVGLLIRSWLITRTFLFGGLDVVLFLDLAIEVKGT